MRSTMLAGIVLAAVAAAPLSAQEPTWLPTRAVWISGGLGRSMVHPSTWQASQYAGSIDLNVQRGDWLVQVRGQFWGQLEGGSLVELGGLFGRSSRSGALSFAGAAGVGIINLDWGDGRSRLTAGIPIMARAALRPLPVLGFAFQVVANVNLQENVAAYQFLLEVGKVR